MSVRTCCGNDLHKPHEDDCVKKKELERRWKEKQKNAVRPSSLRQKFDKK